MLRSFASPKEMNDDVIACTAGKTLVRNYIGQIEDMSEAALTVETELFPADSLTFYTRYNLNTLDLTNPADAELHAKFYNPARGGGQGDYRVGIQEKIDNVVDCLTKFPASKRAVITVPSRSIDHTVDEDAKCLRELHFYLEAAPASDAAAAGSAPAGGAGAEAGAAAAAASPMRLSCTGMMRAQVS